MAAMIRIRIEREMLRLGLSPTAAPELSQALVQLLEAALAGAEMGFAQERVQRSLGSDETRERQTRRYLADLVLLRVLSDSLTRIYHSMNERG